MKLKKKLIIISCIFLILLVTTIVKAFTINGHDLNVREETLQSEKIDKNLDGLLICYFCDLNYGSNLTNEDITKVCETINNFKPDIIVFGGDLIVDESLDTTNVKTFLTNLTANYGKYTVYGEEDIDNETAKTLLKESGFIELNNSNRRLYCDGSFINLVGIDPTSNSDIDVLSAYEGVNPSYYTIVISHYPDLFKKIDQTKTDYVLSGHTLGGPVYIPIIDLLYRPSHGENYFKGKYEENNITLDISDGLGTKKTDVRMFSDFEVVMYKLEIK